MFPYTYNGEQYNSCTDVNSRKLWCSTTRDYNADQKWGYCQSELCNLISVNCCNKHQTQPLMATCVPFQPIGGKRIVNAV